MQDGFDKITAQAIAVASGLPVAVSFFEIHATVAPI
jgi:hypothetical protein